MQINKSYNKLLDKDWFRRLIHFKMTHEDQTQDLILTACADSKIRLYDKVTGVCLKTLEGHQGRVFSAVFNHDGSYIASVSFELDNLIRIWDT